VGIDIRAKGQNGEREVADMLNFIIYTVMKDLGYSEDECLKGMRTVQRNQNQSAVGGNDLTDTFGMSIEVKRQEQLSIGTWWAQCLEAAKPKNLCPVLLYRQNKKAWRARAYVWLHLPSGGQTPIVAEFDIDSFKSWFYLWVKTKLLEAGVASPA
jgi:hypothetical protein